MSQVEAPQAPAADPAAFFAAPPSTPFDLVQAHKRFMADADSTDKFESAVREARAGGNNTMAALGSWVVGDYAKALEAVEGDSELSVFITGMSHYEMGQYDLAVNTFSGCEKSGDTALAAATLHALLGANNTEGFEKAHGSAKLDAADTLYFAARVLEIERNYEAAMAKLEEVIELDPEHFAGRFRLAYRADLFGDDEAAIRLYESFLLTRPIPVSVLVNLGVLYEDRNDFERACGCFGAVLRRDPNNALARLFFTDSHDSLDMFYDENLELKEDQLMKVLRTPISDFELSVRARNCLSNMDIKSLGDLVSHSEPELLEFKNFGETSLNEIKRVLTQKGLRLGMRREDGSFIIPEEFDAARSVDLEAELAWLGPLSEEMREALELQISTLNLSVRCHRALVERLNLQRVGDILLYSEEDLLGMPNFGITSLNELQNKLVDFGLRLRSGRGEEYTGE
ncbi:MAG: hypothetical protein COA70_07020 [Planctomycetota bacterium]|nr:MAG: hypothetical protein COA70_07020 [Planctomycetota bacterium]